jgi:two-component system, LuxR family, response regulator FixJ
MPEPRIVYVVDDDAAVRDSVSLLLDARGLTVQTFASAGEFLDAATALAPGCVVTDLRMPEIDGLELLRRVRERHPVLPVVVMTAHGEVPRAVQALKLGAVDFIEKPFPVEALLNAVLPALEAIGEARHFNDETARIADRLSLLTQREREVMDELIAGHQNKVIAYHLGISPRTVEVHRARVMEKMGARSLSALVRMGIAARQISAVNRS